MQQTQRKPKLLQNNQKTNYETIFFSRIKSTPTAQELIARKIEIETELAKLDHPINTLSTIGRQTSDHRKVLEEELMSIEASLDKLLEKNLHSKDTVVNKPASDDTKYSVIQPH